MDSTKRYLVTTALPYANGPVHIGHLAGVYVPADIYVRYLRMRGREVVFIGGSDEHGVPITIKARTEGVSPQDVVDRYHNIIKDSFERFGISFDIYSRTSSEIHHKTASDFFSKLYNEKQFVEKETEQYYDPEAQQFLADRYIVGTCPHCQNERAYGDQCEQCGTSLNATDLINPKSTLTNASPVLKPTRHYYLPLDKFEPFLTQWILEEHKEWKPNVYGQCKSWIDLGLQPRAVTRDLDWGVPVPLADAEGKVLYVWFDAPIGYISNTKELLPNDWKRYWQDSDTNLVCFIGKDNIVFHCIIFPAMLKAHGDYILPTNVPANEFLNLENDKISTSRNWAVWLHEYLEDFPGKEDVLRYVLTANMPETKDNNFTWKDFQERNNSELLSIYGNFVNRTTVLLHKHYGGAVPQPALKETDEAVLREISAIRMSVERNVESFHFRQALSDMLSLARLGNKYLADEEPWKTVKTDAEKTATTLYVAVQIAASLAVMSEPFLPFTAKKLRDMLRVTSETGWEALGQWELLPVGHTINEAFLLFEKIEDSVIEAQLSRLERIKKENDLKNYAPAAVKPNVQFEDFSKMDLRVVTVLEAQKVPKTDKLIRLLVDTGLERRTVVSGIAKDFSAEELVGKQVCMLMNLEPRKMKGIESQGMILLAQNADGKLVFVTPEVKVSNGSTIS